MTDVVWLFWGRAMIAYARAATMPLLIRMRPLKTTTIEHNQRTNGSKIGYIIMGFVYAIAVYQVFDSIRLSMATRSTALTSWAGRTSWGQSRSVNRPT